MRNVGNRLGAAVASLGCLLSAPLSLLANPLAPPPGLNPGDQYRIIFVTSSGRTALSPDIAVYNAFVSDIANGVGVQSVLSGLNVSWFAVASTPTISARDNIGGSSALPIYRPDGVLVANGTADLWDGLTVGLNVTQNLDIFEQQHPWTGSYADGSAVPGHELGSCAPSQCDPFTGPTVIAGYTGAEYLPSQYAFFVVSGTPTEERLLYGISSAITVPDAAPVPEPASWGMMAAGSGLMLARVLRRRNSRRA